MRARSGASRTGELPWVELVDVDLGDDGDGDGEPSALAAEVVHHQLLVRRVEPEPRRQMQVLTAAAHRVCLSLSIDRAQLLLLLCAEPLSSSLLLMVGRGRRA